MTEAPKTPPPEELVQRAAFETFERADPGRLLSCEIFFHACDILRSGHTLCVWSKAPKALPHD